MMAVVHIAMRILVESPRRKHQVEAVRSSQASFQLVAADHTAKKDLAVQ